jgi:hypothetical protein
METPRRRPQFSLATLILLCLLIGAFVMMFLSQRKAQGLKSDLEKLQAENTDLRNQLGMLTVIDAAKVNVIAIPTLDDHTWRWRIYLPDGQNRKYRIHYTTDDVPPNDFYQKGSRVFACDNGLEIVLSATIRKNSGGVWLLKFAQSRTSETLGLKDAEAAALTSAIFVSQTGVGGTKTIDADGRIELLRVRTIKRDREPELQEPLPAPNSDPCPGLLIWIEREKPPSTN